MVTRLKGGDPVLFGQGAEKKPNSPPQAFPLRSFPASHHPSLARSTQAFPSRIVTTSQLTIFTGHEDPTKPESSLDYAHLAKTPGTRVMLMGVERMMVITGELIKHGAIRRPRSLSSAGPPEGNQQHLTGTLGDIADKVKAAGFQHPQSASSATWSRNVRTSTGSKVVRSSASASSSLARAIRPADDQDSRQARSGCY